MDAGEYIIYETEAGYRFGVVIGGGAMALAQSYRGIPIGYIMLSEAEIAALTEFYQKVADEKKSLVLPLVSKVAAEDAEVSSPLLTKHECQCEGGCQCQ